MLNFKKNQKQFMAVFSIGLMIAFALPSAVKNYSDKREIVIGNAGKLKITNKDLAAAKDDWEKLRQVFIQQSNPTDPTAGPRAVSLLDAVLGPARALEFQNKLELYVLLLREADQMGITVTIDEVKELLTNRARPNGETIPDADLAPAVQNLLKIYNAERRAGTSLHPGLPQVRDALARMQPFSLEAVQFKAEDYLSLVPPYTEAQKLQRSTELYDQYKAFEPTTRPTKPGTNEPQDDFSFGYRVPNQAQTQYIEVPRDAVVRLVRPKITEVDAIKYYLEHKQEYPTSQPARDVMFHGSPPPAMVAAPSQPASVTLPSIYTQAVPLHIEPSPNAPALGFKDYKDKVYDALTTERANQFAADLIEDLNNRMTADYQEFRKSPAGAHLTPASTSMPASAPSVPESSLGVAYTSFEYLQKLALEEQKSERFGLLPTVGQDYGLRTALQLDMTPNIGGAALPGMEQLAMSILRSSRNTHDFMILQLLSHFPGYVTNFVEPLVSAEVNVMARQMQTRIIALYEPSPIFESGSFSGKTATGGLFIFRAVQAVPAHAAPQGEVMDRLLADARLADAYALAHKDAEKFAALATQTNLASAAATMSKPVVTTGLLDSRTSVDTSALGITDAQSREVFINSAFGVLQSNPKGTPQHPLGVIDVKPATMVVVGQVDEIKPPWSSTTLTAYEREMELQAASANLGGVQAIWFDPADIMRRMQYVPAPSSNSTPKNNAPIPDQPNQNPLVP